MKNKINFFYFFITIDFLFLIPIFYGILSSVFSEIIFSAVDSLLITLIAPIFVYYRFHKPYYGLFKITVFFLLVEFILLFLFKINFFGFSISDVFASSFYKIANILNVKSHFLIMLFTKYIFLKEVFRRHSK